MLSRYNPVLSRLSDDYIKECKFDVTFDEEQIVIDDENINIPLKFVLVSSGLNNYIKNGSATVIVLIKSSAAFYLFEIGHVSAYSLALHLEPVFIIKDIYNLLLSERVIAVGAVAQYLIQSEK